MNDSPTVASDEREILELLDAAETGHARRQFASAHQLFDLGDRLIAQQAALKEIQNPTPNPTGGATAPR